MIAYDCYMCFNCSFNTKESSLPVQNPSLGRKSYAKLRLSQLAQSGQCVALIWVWFNIPWMVETQWDVYHLSTGDSDFASIHSMT